MYNDRDRELYSHAIEINFRAAQLGFRLFLAENGQQIGISDLQTIGKKVKRKIGEVDQNLYLAVVTYKSEILNFLSEREIVVDDQETPSFDVNLAEVVTGQDPSDKVMDVCRWCGTPTDDPYSWGGPYPLCRECVTLIPVVDVKPIASQSSGSSGGNCDPDSSVCYCCKSQKWWAGVVERWWICGLCHPPVTPDIIKAGRDWAEQR